MNRSMLWNWNKNVDNPSIYQRNSNPRDEYHCNHRWVSKTQPPLMQKAFLPQQTTDLLWSQPLWPALAVMQRKAKTGPENKLWIKGWTRPPRPRKWPAGAWNLGLMWYKYSTGKCTWHAMIKSPSAGIAINHMPKAFNFQPQNYFHSIKQLLSSTASSSYNLCSLLPVSLSSSPYR